MAFEPVPEHVALLRKAITTNDLNGRVTLYPVAVGTRAQQSYISTEGLRSQVMFEDGPTRVQTRVVDFFEQVGAEVIDILKLDCEGSEYDLLMDRRFAQLKVRTLLLEWHANKNRPHADRETRSPPQAWLANQPQRGGEHSYRPRCTNRRIARQSA